MAVSSPLHKTFFDLRSNLPPHAWESFVKDFAAYVDQVTVAVTNAPFDMVLNAQGRAQQCRAELQAITECHKFADRQEPTTPIQR